MISKKTCPLFLGMIAALTTDDTLAVRCSNATLKGTYLYDFSGSLSSSNYSEAGMDVYDGRGGVVSQFTNNNSAAKQVVTGTYTVKADCSGIINYGGGEFNSIYVSPTGDSLVYILSNPNGTPDGINGSIGKEERVSKAIVKIVR